MGASGRLMRAMGNRGGVGGYRTPYYLVVRRRRRPALAVGLLAIAGAIVVAAVMLACSGCNTVWVRGEALTALENSAVQAEVAARLAENDAAVPVGVRRYLRADADSWAAFVSAARRHKWTAAPSTQPGQ